MRADGSGLTVVVLAGGRGTRLAPVVGRRPKVLAEVGGRPFVMHLFEQVAAAGVQEVVLATGVGADEVRATLGATWGALRLVYSEEPAAAGTGGALRLAAHAGSGDLVLAMNGDSYCGVDLAAVVAAHRRRGAGATMVVTAVDDTRRFGTVALDPADRVTGFHEKADRPGPGWINAGIYVLARTRLTTIPPGGPVSLEREVLPGWVGRGLLGYRADGPFIDIGTPEDYRAAARVLGRGSRVA